MNDSKAGRITKFVLALVLFVPVGLGIALGILISSPVVAVVALALSAFPAAIICEAITGASVLNSPKNDGHIEELLDERATRDWDLNPELVGSAAYYAHRSLRGE